MPRNRVLRYLLEFLGVVVLLVAAAVVILVSIDLRPVIERTVSHNLDRRLTMASLKIGWRNPLSVEVGDLRLANAPWGSQPDMIHIASLTARVDLWSLLHGVMRFESLRVEKPVVLLERNSEGVGNWHFTDSKPSDSGGLALVPKNRRQFPTLIDLTLNDGALTYRATSSDLHFAFDELTLRSPGSDTPVRLTTKGAYNGVPVTLTGDTQSYDTLRNAAVPYGTVLNLTVPPGKLGFDGTMTEPLDFEGVNGALRIDASDLGAFLKIFGAEIGDGLPLALAGHLDKQGDHWRLSDAAGRLARDDVTGTLEMLEGKRGQPDDISLALDFKDLDLKALLDAGGGGSSEKPVSIRLDDKPGAIVAARIGAKQVRYGTMRVADAAIDGKVGVGEVALNSLSFTAFGGRLDAAGKARSVANGTRITANAALSGADAGQLGSAIGAAPGDIRGRFDAGVTVETQGAMLSDALAASRGDAVLAMTGGRVTRTLVEKASTDLRALFRKGEGSLPIACLLGVVILRDGVATISPLRLRTPDATLVGGGQVDLVKQRVDLTIKSQGAKSVFALGVPLHVTGSFQNLKVVPALGSSATWLDAPERDEPARHLAPAVQKLATGNPCLR
ncbi:MAG: AsmA family protein [Rhodospirillales bacterium]|nr:AsmA family protein [Rhodospirillales bacterium]